MADQILAPDPWLSVKQAAVYAGLSESLILRSARRGDLKGYKVGLGKKLWKFRQSDLDALITSGTPEHAEQLRLVR